jgi:hypothetical protein
MMVTPKPANGEDTQDDILLYPARPDSSKSFRETRPKGAGVLRFGSQGKAAGGPGGISTDH